MSDTWTDRLSEYLDDELTSGEREALEAHLVSCAECTRTLEELRRVVASAQTLKPLPPASDLWAGIAEKTVAVVSEPAGVAPFDRAQGRPFRPRRPWKISFTMPQLAAASLLLAAVSSATAWQLRPAGAGGDLRPAAAVEAPVGTIVDDSTPPPSGGASVTAVTPVSFADQEYDAAVGDLEKTLKEDRSLLDPATIAIVEQNLAIINVAIEQARQALDADPANGYLSSHLVEARRKKLDLLRRTAAMAADTSHS